LGLPARRLAEIAPHAAAPVESAWRTSQSLRKALADRIELLRWQPVRRLLGPLDAQVSSLAQRLGKDVALRVVGGDLSVPAEQIAPVLAVVPHMLRNALDHGIEPAGTRGDKSPQARLELGFRDAGDAWLLAVRDDGRGIDTERLRERALELGLIESGAQLSHEQLCALIFAPKLSTAHDVSDVSGRGEGMAAVAEAVASCAGSIAVRSKPGIGTTIEIRLPKHPAPSASA
jgi:two-component system chemotaxis sensor kinase CheA